MKSNDHHFYFLFQDGFDLSWNFQHLPEKVPLFVRESPPFSLQRSLVLPTEPGNADPSLLDGKLKYATDSRAWLKYFPPSENEDLKTMAQFIRRFFNGKPLVYGLRNFSDGAKPLVVKASDSSPLKLSESCVTKLKEVAGPGESLRITVDSGGCSGFQYNFELDTKVSADDVIIEDQGVRVVIDNTSLSFLEGAVVDYHSEMIKSSFRVTNNPKAEAGCSCGVSFSVKLD